MRRPNPLLVTVALCAAVLGAFVLTGVTDVVPAPTALPVRPPQVSSPAPTNHAARPLARSVVRDALVLVGQCVDWDTGAPVAGCDVQVVGDVRHEVQSDAAGRWRVECHDDPWAVFVRVGHRDYVVAERIIDRRQHGALRVGLRRGGRVRGRLQDVRGKPLAGAVVQLGSIPHAERGDGWCEPCSLSTRVDVDGSFGLPERVPLGPVTVTVEGAPPLLGTANHVITAETYLELRCERTVPSESVTGWVLDPAGNGVAGALVQARAQSEPVATARTGPGGRFRLFGGVRRGLTCSLSATAIQRGRVLETIVHDIRWGAVDEVLQLSPGQAVPLRVTDAESGAPIESYAVQSARVSGVRSGRSGVQQIGGSHPAGWASLAGLQPGDHRLIVWPEDDRWLPNLPVAFSVVEHDQQPVHVRLKRARPCRVLVLDGFDRPVVAARVQLLRPGDHDVVRNHGDLLRNGASRSRLGVRLAEAVTGVDGIATLRWFDDPSPLVLRISGGRQPPTELADVRLSRDGLVVHVGAAGTLDLSLGGAEGWQVIATRQDVVRDVIAAPPSWSAPCVLDGSGRALLSLPEGSWDVSIFATIDGRRRTMPVAQGLRISAGRSTTVKRDLRAAMAPASWTAQVFCDGEPVRVAVIEIGERGLDGKVRGVHAMRVALDEQGRLDARGLLPGHYALHVPWSCAGQQVRVPLTKWVELGPRERRDDSLFSIVTGGIELRLVDDDEQPVSKGMVVLRGDNGCVLACRPGESGVVDLMRVPVGRYELSWRDQGGARDIGSVRVVESTRSRVVRLRVQAP